MPLHRPLLLLIIISPPLLGINPFSELSNAIHPFLTFLLDLLSNPSKSRFSFRLPLRSFHPQRNSPEGPPIPRQTIFRPFHNDDGGRVGPGEPVVGQSKHVPGRRTARGARGHHQQVGKRGLIGAKSQSDQ